MRRLREIEGYALSRGMSRLGKICAIGAAFCSAALALAPQPAAAGACASNAVQRLIERPAPILPPAGAPRRDAFVVLYSGDGGWAQADCAFAELLAQRGYPVVGVNSIRYFARGRTAKGAAADLARTIDAYGARWGRPKVILMGYSFGASALPLIAAALPAAERPRIAALALAGPGERAELVLRPRTWFGRVAAGAPPVEPALERLKGLKIICVYGERDPRAACPRLAPGLAQMRPVASDHRFAGAYRQVIDAVAPVGDAASAP